MALSIPIVIKISYVIVCVVTIFWWICKKWLENWNLLYAHRSASTRQVIEKCQKLQKVVVKLEKKYHYGMYNHIRIGRHFIRTDNPPYVYAVGIHDSNYNIFGLFLIWTLIKKIQIFSNSNSV